MLHTENRLRKGECSVSSFSTFIPEPALLFSRSSRLSSSGDLPDPGWPIGRRRVERQKVAQLVRPPSPDRHSDSGAKRDSGVKIGSGRRQTPRSTWGADNLDRSRLPPPPPSPRSPLRTLLRTYTYTSNVHYLQMYSDSREPRPTIRYPPLSVLIGVKPRESL